jgi:hypothetical protein
MSLAGVIRRLAATSNEFMFATGVENSYPTIRAEGKTVRRDSAEKAEHWLEKQWLNLLQLKEDGVPILGFTWYSLIDQTDWDTALCELNYRTNPCGLFDKDRHPHPVAKRCARVIRGRTDQLPP